MLSVKQGFPEPDEIVMCTVKKIQPHAVTVSLDEYHKHGLIHISEISPGRIRNIRDYVKEGKVIVCKVLRVNQERGYIDLSLRRVTERLKRNKVNEQKQEQIAEKILEFVGKEYKKTAKQLYDELQPKFQSKFDSLYSLFEAVVEEDFKLESLKIEKKLAGQLEEAIRQRIKPVEVKIGGEVTISTYSPTGVEDIKKALLNAEETDEKVTIRYLGAGRYAVEVKHSNFKDAETMLADVIEKIKAPFEKDVTSAVDFERKELKA